MGSKTKYSIFDNLMEGIQIISYDWVYIYVNKMVCEHGNKNEQELVGKKMTEVYPGIETTEMFRMLEKCMKERSNNSMTNEFSYPDDSKKWFLLSVEPVEEGILIMSMDITQKMKLEQQLQQSQKLEAVGKLAGGIAHDFNNLLSIIIGYCELLKEENVSQSLKSIFDDILKASKKAALLTKQLLAFSRKQIFELKYLNLNFLVLDLENMIKRLIGEDIDLRINLNSDLGIIKADNSQIEQVIINLVVNARDALPQGGIITIETDNVYLNEEYNKNHAEVKPGNYVQLVVTDNGVGMDEKTKSRIFEPFFTTKEFGRGTGLGLATIYGIIKQSEGHIWCYSELNHGTAFKIYFPVENEQFRTEGKSDLPLKDFRGTETILVIEDDDLSRNVLVSMLKKIGYTVIDTSNGFSALSIIKNRKQKIDLIITDIVMPKMNGKQLANKIKQVNPGIKIIYTSGYTENVIQNHGILEKEVNFIQKPFNIETLALKVRRSIDF